MGKLRDLSVIIFMVIISVIAYDSYPYILSTLNAVESAANHSKLAAIDLQRTTTLEANLIGDKGAVRSFGLLFRSGDNLYRSSIKLEDLLDRLVSITDKVDNETLPRINVVLDSVDNTIKIFSEDTHNSLITLSLTLSQARVLLSDPNFPIALSRVAKILESANITVEEANKELPELIKLLEDIEKNVGRGSNEVANLVAQFNQPVTKKQKVFRTLL